MSEGGCSLNSHHWNENGKVITTSNTIYCSTDTQNYVSSLSVMISKNQILTYLQSMFPFYTPLVFSGGIKWEHWPEMD